MKSEEPIAVARQLVAERFPDAIQAWLGGSVVNGGATLTSDLDVTILLDIAEVHRESLVFHGWPVELFVHDDRSIRYFVDKDLARRRPTMARLVATSLPCCRATAATNSALTVQKSWRPVLGRSLPTPSTRSATI